ncbi:ABC transporter substrate-binding protein [Paenibacillus oleatilyticus]|uniref:ABC transporter substrate-binding protein n=1 Tax=Paenibacillus oleatilyticus TaxID=2594886 RepID=UPI0020A78E63|nr:extracellular solute-binding protein [Paenibacillus oleatilyticus]
MRKAWLSLSGCLLMIAATACSAGGGSGEAAQPEGGPNKNEAQAETANKTTETAQSQGGKKTVVLSTLFHGDFFKDAKRKYEEKHPNIEIQISYHQMDEGDPHAEEKIENFIKKTNTQMLSGKGPDLVEMDHLPMDNYVNKKVLANLSDMMEKDPEFKKEQYFQNILEGVKLNGSVYGMPTSFFLDGLVGDEEAIRKTGVTFDDARWTWSEFSETAKAMAKKGDQRYGFMSYPAGLLNVMVKSNYSLYVDQVNRKANFQSEPFINLMKQVKSMFDEKVVTQEPRQAYFRMQHIISPADYILTPKEIFDQPKLYSKPKGEGQKAGGFFHAYRKMGINEKSAVKKEAWDFIKFLMSEEMQPSPERAGFPMNKAIFHKQVKQLLQTGTVKAHEEGPLKGKTFKVTEADLQGLEQHVSGAIYHVPFQPSKLEGIIIKESEAFFKGQKSAEDVAKLIQNRATTFLNE